MDKHYYKGIEICVHFLSFPARSKEFINSLQVLHKKIDNLSLNMWIDRIDE